MIHAIPLWASFLAFVGLQLAVLLYTGLPLWQQKREGQPIDRDARRQFRSTNLGVAAVLLILLDAVGLLRLLGIDPMMTLVHSVVWAVDWMRSF